MVHRVADTWLVLDREASGELIGLRLADESVRSKLFMSAPRRGRGSAPTVTLDSGLSIVLRRYRHGGLLGGVTRGLLLGLRRPLAELDVSARAEALGAPVPHVVCVILWPVAGPLWSAMIGTREEPYAEELLAVWARHPPGHERYALLRRVGAAIRRLHDAGVLHPDLQVRNILLCPETPERIVVIDLDRARLRAARSLRPAARATNLARLIRSAIKEGLLPGTANRREIAALVGGYVGPDRALRRALLRRAPWERLKIALHRIGYRFRSAR
ncbi:MAG: lipopolysaccharide kinase InaA family protein [Myxococcota bacterium]